MANPRLLLTPVAGGGTTGLSLAWAAPAGTAAPVGVAGTDGVQTVTITGTPTGGTFTLTWNGQTTAAIPYNATSAQVTTALRALAGGQSITSSGGPLPTTGVAVTFPKLINQSLMTGDATLLTGGSSPAVVVTNTTPGTQTTNPASATIPAAYKDLGLTDQKGATFKTNVSSNPVKSFGSLQTQRVIMTDQAKSVDLTLQETNAYSVAMYNGLPLGSVTPDASGFFQVATGLPTSTQYAMIFDAFDGANHLRYYAPYAQNTAPGDLNLATGQIIDRPLTLSLYPDANGNTLYEYYIADALKV
ncbi:MAG: phage tail tube protein [Mycobacteriaceae bacterium]